jgi:uncharacterized protein involved in outer membrane biogenesis
MLKKLLIVLAVLVAIAAILLTRDWDSPELGQAVLDKVNEATGVAMTAGGFRLNLLKGVVLTGVKASKFQDGRKMDLAVERFVVEHRLVPLLTGTVALQRIVIDKPRIEIIEPGPASAGEGGAGAPGVEPDAEAAAETPPTEERATEPADFTLEVRQLSIRDGIVVLRREGEDAATRAQGLDFSTDNLTIDPDAGTLTGITAAGSLEISEIAFGNFKVTDTRGRYSMAEGRFDLPELSAVVARGRVTANMQIDFKPVPYVYSLAMQGEGLDLNELIGASRGLGPAALDLKADGVGSGSRELKGKGSIALAAGTLPDAPVFKDIDRTLGKEVVVGAAYQATRAEFSIADNIATLAPFRFETARARLDTAGKANLDGPLDLELSVATPREGIRIGGVGSDVLDLLTDEQGWVPIPMSVAGTMEDPKVRLDTKALLSQAGAGYKRGLSKDLEEKASDLLEGLFRKKK